MPDAFKTIQISSSDKTTDGTSHAAGAKPSAGGRMITVDENGDAVFRFRLKPEEAPTDEALSEFYRAEIYDLLKIVRLYFRGKPVLVDAFAFRNEPERIQPLQRRKDPPLPEEKS